MTQQTTTHARHGDERQSGNTLHEEANALAETQTDWARLEAMTDEEALQNALDDPDSQPLTPELRSRLRRVPNPKAIRLAMGLSQEAFARRFEIAVGTLRDWEQGAHIPDSAIPDSAAKAYLRVIEADPDAVVQALARGRRGQIPHSE
jgi:putative transcriptional regulator